MKAAVKANVTESEESFILNLETGVKVSVQISQIVGIKLQTKPEDKIKWNETKHCHYPKIQSIQALAY